MKDHPLTPMWDSRIRELIRPQSRYEAYPVSLERMAGSRDALTGWLKEKRGEAEHCYFIPDYFEEAHGRLIMDAFGELPLLTGGSGLMAAVVERCREAQGDGVRPPFDTKTVGQAVLLAGSCSAATLAQIDDYRDKGGPSLRVDPVRLMEGSQTVEELIREVERTDGLLIYGSSPADEVREIQRAGKEKVSGLLEAAMARIASAAVNMGKTRIIVAGGETSGAVTRELGYSSYLIGESVAPGVPVMIPTGDRRIRLVLKSGNFGQTDFSRGRLR